MIGVCRIRRSAIRTSLLLRRRCEEGLKSALLGHPEDCSLKESSDARVERHGPLGPINICQEHVNALSAGRARRELPWRSIPYITIDTYCCCSPPYLPRLLS